MAIHVSATYREFNFVAPVFVANLSVKLTDKVIKELTNLEAAMKNDYIWSQLKANTLIYEQFKK